MDSLRKIEIFSGGKSVCEDLIEWVKNTTFSFEEVKIRDINKPENKQRARELGIRSVPAVVIDGDHANCCTNQDPDKDLLRENGVGKPANWGVSSV